MPGFVFIRTVNWLSGYKPHNITVFVLLCCASGYILNSLILSILLEYCSKYIATALYLCICFMLGVLIGKLRTVDRINKLFGKVFYKTLNNFFEDALDFKQGSNIIAHMNNGKQIYGQVKFLDDTKKPKWIYLEQGVVSYKSELIKNTHTNDTVKGIIVPVQEIEYIEVT